MDFFICFQTRALVGVAVGAFVRFSFPLKTIHTNSTISSSSSNPELITLIPPILTNRITLTTSYSLSSAMANNNRLTASYATAPVDETLLKSPVGNVVGLNDEVTGILQDFFSRLFWSVIAVLSQSFSKTVTRFSLQGLSVLIPSLGPSLFPAVEVIKRTKECFVLLQYSKNVFSLNFIF